MIAQWRNLVSTIEIIKDYNLYGVNVVDLVDNMRLGFFLFFSKTFQKKNSCTAYTMKKNSDEASN